MKSALKTVKKNWGAYLLFLVFGALFFILLTRFLTLQITGEAEGRNLAAQAEAQYARERTLEAERGKIVDRHGEVIAEDTSAYKIVAVLNEEMKTNAGDPNYVEDPEQTAEILSEHLSIEKSEILETLEQGIANERFQVEFGPEGKDIPLEIKSALEDLELPGIFFLEDLKRFYPNGIFSSHLVGFARPEEQADGTVDAVGQMGIEKNLNKYLQGKNGKMEYEVDAREFFLPSGEETIQKAKDGNDVYLTLDKKVQTFLEDAMSQVAEEYNPKQMYAVVADPKTGEILAMSQRPTFDPDSREGLSDNWLNQIVESTFEPGSTFKAFSLAAAVEEGVFNPNAVYQSGTYDVLGTVIGDHNNGAGWGEISYLEGVQRSSNVAFAKLLESMGEDRYESYLEAFGFGSPTGIDLPNEAGGNILYDWPIEKVTTVFGQGTTVTPLQMIQAQTAVANDGKMMTPYVISKIVDPNTDMTIHKGEPEVSGEPISAETAAKVREYLATTITSENGTGQPFAIPGYEVSGKSGTAQIPDPDTGKYMQGRSNYLFSFMGMAPADDPELIVYVAIQQPSIGNSEIGSDPVSKVFNPVMLNSLKYLNIEPAEAPSAKAVAIENYEGENAGEIKKALEEQGIETVLLGNGETVIGQSSKDTSLLAGEKFILLTDGELTIPDVSGWSVRDVIKMASLAKLEINTAGSGYAQKQSIKPDTPISGDEPLIVSFGTNDQQQSSETDEEDLVQD
ncbi:penicillin-binding transpeptidase domain-containing protein [Jeotgalibacillus sp. ET6]|uniref:penicillin-binding protein n=1 Tax=Jeotgalibacillus sp. ET6 TaxID=3037260 RepID=UPI002418A39E|nr:penicillin-binding transpeptidase domain-containing protein [Jeotgalibacillus sp. ET6]MDG5470198.1 penicillin-binding transpeptidase domain-containing protein [Jeotgalibacillus sp. ET6]